MHGEIKYEDRFKQLISFEGMERHRKIRPTDIDGFIDYGGNSFVYIELKYGDAPLTIGQKKALENVVKSHMKAGNPSCAFLVRHNCKPEDFIVAKNQMAVEVYYKGWKKIDMTLLAAIEKWEMYCKNNNIKI